MRFNNTNQFNYVPVISIAGDGMIDLEDVFEEYADNIYTYSFNAIKLSLKKDQDIAYVCKIKNEGETFYEIIIESYDWPEHLESAIQYYEDNEDYEKCAQILSLLKDIKKREDNQVEY